MTKFIWLQMGILKGKKGITTLHSALARMGEPAGCCYF